MMQSANLLHGKEVYAQLVEFLGKFDIINPLVSVAPTQSYVVLNNYVIICKQAALVLAGPLARREIFSKSY